jgi:predicted patatin/cPLA2 family phospholipase
VLDLDLEFSLLNMVTEFQQLKRLCEWLNQNWKKVKKNIEKIEKLEKIEKTKIEPKWADQ